MTSPVEPEPSAIGAEPVTVAGPTGSWFEPSPESSVQELPADQPAATPRRQRRRRGMMALVLLIVLGVAGVAGGGVALVRELTRSASKTEIAAAVAKEIASRWQRLPAGRIFPAHVNYQNGQDDKAVATLVGIAAPGSCQGALDAAVYRQIRSFGCATMLRATYTDSSGTVAATMGIAVMGSPRAATMAQAKLQPLSASGGLHTLALSGTITDRFGDASRAVAGGVTAGPYLIFFAAGRTDGVPGKVVALDPEPEALANGLVQALSSVLTKHGAPCQMQDVRC
jgi:hypothetical protein